MPSIRPAAMAGTFYPGDASGLAAEIAAYLAEARASADEQAPKAVIAPHAGYMYSGPIAASAYARLAPLRGTVGRVVLAGPAHRVFVRGAAVPDADAFDSPLGAVPLDRELLDRLALLPFVEVSARAHAFEHSLEVHLPFLQSVLGDFKLAPVVVGGATPPQMAQLLEAAWGGPETLVVVSSDLSHYHPYDVARTVDRRTVERILKLDAALEPEEACGAAPINGLLELARRRGLAPELLDLRNSGDTAGGRDRVVGYAAFAFHER
jgi:AmmeMemoRadiSam system protein B